MASELTIDLAPSGKLRLGFEGYSIDIPPTRAGIKYLVQILQARHDRGSSKKIAMPTSPTQAMCDAWLKEEAKRAKQRVQFTYIDVEL